MIDFSFPGTDSWEVLGGSGFIITSVCLACVFTHIHTCTCAQEEAVNARNSWIQYVTRQEELFFFKHLFISTSVLLFPLNEKPWNSSACWGIKNREKKKKKGGLLNIGSVCVNLAPAWGSCIKEGSPGIGLLGLS